MTDLTGTVMTQPRFFFGTHTKCEHEQFTLDTPQGQVQIIDNVDIAPRVFVRPGDRVEVCGEMVHDPGKLPILHWTHHDPAHKHPDGFIRFQGKVYA